MHVTMVANLHPMSSNNIVFFMRLLGNIPYLVHHNKMALPNAKIKHSSLEVGLCFTQLLYLTHNGWKLWPRLLIFKTGVLHDHLLTLLLLNMNYGLDRGLDLNQISLIDGFLDAQLRGMFKKNTVQSLILKHIIVFLLDMERTLVRSKMLV